MQDYEKIVAECYSTWGKTYYDEYYGEKAPYPPVHTELLRRLLRKIAPQNLLDAGCGPASFLRDVTDMNIDLYGFDLTPEMVKEAKSVMQAKGIPADNIWQGSILDDAAFATPDQTISAYDVVISGGVLPHITERDEDRMLANIKAALNPGGTAIVEARNQLFALFTMNRYSYDFIREDLIRAGQLAAKAGDQAESVTQKVEAMKQFFRTDTPPIRKGKKDEPGYDEVVSRTHNPLVMRRKFEDMGFRNVRVLFYHYHCVPPMFGAELGDFFIKASVAMEDPEDWRGYFMASAFYVTGEKA